MTLADQPAMQTTALRLKGRLPLRAVFNPKTLAVLFAGVGQLVMLSSMAVVSRHYSAEALSKYGIFFSLFSIFQIVNSLRIEQAILYEKAPDDRRDMYVCAQSALLPVSLLTALAGAAYLYHGHFAISDLFTISICLLVAANGSAFSRANTLNLVAQDKLKFVPFLNFLRPCLIGLFQMSGVLFSGSAGNDLILCFTASQVVYAMVTGAMLGAGELRHLLAMPMVERLGPLRKARPFILFSLPQNLVFTVSEAITPLALPLFYPTDGAVGLFWLASRVVFAPATIIAESIRPMIYKTIANSGERMLARALTIGAMLALPILMGVVVLNLYGETLFALVFGKEWARANDFAVILGLLVAFNMFALPFVGALPVLRLQGYMLGAELLGMGARIIAITLLPLKNSHGMVLYSSSFYIITMAIFLAYVGHVMRISRNNGGSV